MTAEQKLLLSTLADETDLVLTYLHNVPVDDANWEYIRSAREHAIRVRDALNALVAEARRQP